MVEILSQKQTTKFSKPFGVYEGQVVVISSFNFACEQTDEVGEVTRPGDCAILHKIDISGDVLPQGDGCVNCGGCILEGLDISVTNSEPVVVCGETWTHNSANNLSILTVPGVYMFELCNEDSIGSVSIRIEELGVEQATLLPKPLIHGE